MTEDPNFSYLILGLLKSRLWWSLLRRNWSQPSAWAAWAAQTLEVKLFVETQQLKPQMGDRFTSYFSSDTSRSPAQLTQSKQEIEKILNRVTRDDIQDTFHQVRLFNIKFSSFKMSSSIAPTHGRGCLGNLLCRVITLQFLPRVLSQNKHDADNCLRRLRGCSHTWVAPVSGLCSSCSPGQQMYKGTLKVFKIKALKWTYQNSGRHSCEPTCRWQNAFYFPWIIQMQFQESSLSPPLYWWKTSIISRCLSVAAWGGGCNLKVMRHFDICPL